MFHCQPQLTRLFFIEGILVCGWIKVVVCNKIGHFCVAIIKEERRKKERERLGTVGRRDCSMGTEGRQIEFEGGPE